MNTSEFFLMAICALLLFASIMLLISRQRLFRKVERLTGQIDEFVSKGKNIPFSTGDDRFAALQNGVCELERLYLIEKDNAEKASRKNTEFISDISHQLKTPLAAIRLYVEIDNSERPSSHTEYELQLIGKMENLIYRLLRLEKIRSDAYIMSFEETDLEKLAVELTEEYIRLYPDKKYTVSGSGRIRADKAWLGEALSNIIKNASEHTAENGSIDISVSSSERSTFITIEDDGGGVNEEELPKLFERFHRSSNARPDGAGIGLAIARAVVEKHHGTIYAENTAKGLKIVICLPQIDGFERI